MSEIKNIIAEGKSILGIEFGSTRIKAVLIEPDTFKPIAQGAHEWENRLEDGLWTYHLMIFGLDYKTAIRICKKMFKISMVYKSRN